MLVDLRGIDITGKAAEHALDAAGITVNKNTIPFDPASPFVTSGIRLGTAAMTTRGFKETDMKEVARLIGRVLKQHEDEAVIAEALQDVQSLTAKFPLYPERG